MTSRRTVIAGLLGALVVSAGPALAAQTVPYTPEAFEAAIEDDPIAPHILTFLEGRPEKSWQSRRLWDSRQ